MMAAALIGGALMVSPLAAVLIAWLLPLSRRGRG